MISNSIASSLILACALAAPAASAVSTAVEYYHGGYCHYFVTASAQEMAKLDAVGEEDRCELLDLIGTITHQRASTDGANIEQARRQLSDLLFYLET